MEKIVLLACLAAAVLLNPAYAIDSGYGSNVMVALLKL